LPETGGELTSLTKGAEEIHKVMATFVSIYWGGPIALAVLQELLAHGGTLRRMFWLTAI
jgi:hypothetical protein